MFALVSLHAQRVLALIAQMHNGVKPAGRPKAATGRKSRYTPKVVAKILKEISQGVPHKYAAMIAGISYQAFLDWQHAYPEFATQVDLAKAKYIAWHVKQNTKHAKNGSPNASWFALERADPENFARPETKIALQQFNQINVLGGIEFCSPAGRKALDAAREELNKVQAIRDRPGELDVSVYWDGETWKKPAREVEASITSAPE